MNEFLVIPNIPSSSHILLCNNLCYVICIVFLVHPECKVIRIGKRVQPDISKARQQVNIDRPAYNKTDKQCRTRTTITARLPDG